MPVISLGDAQEMTTLFREYRNVVINTEYIDRDVLPFCETFPKSEIESLINQQGCSGFRIYFGMDDDLKVHLILVAADANGADMVATDPPDVILEDGQRCPVHCPPSSPLNE